MRSRITLLIFLVTVASTAGYATVSIVSPLSGSQVIGNTLVEVTTDLPDVNRVELYVDGSLAGVARAAPFRFTHDFGEELSKRHVIEAVAFASAYKVRESTRIETAAFGGSESMNVDFVEVRARLRTSRQNLTASDFTLLENGKTQSLREIRRDRQPAHFVFVVDRSLSMGDGKLDAAIAAVRRGLTRFQPGDDAQLLLFNHRVDSPRPISPGFRSGEILPSGGTSLRDAVASLKSVRKGFVVVITDGGDRNSITSAADALRDISSGNLSVYAITLGGGEGSDFLRTAAQRSGGLFLSSSRDRLLHDIDRVMSEINSRYTISYQSTNSGKGWRTIELRAARGIEVGSYRKGYFAE